MKNNVLPVSRKCQLGSAGKKNVEIIFCFPAIEQIIFYQDAPSNEVQMTCKNVFPFT